MYVGELVNAINELSDEQESTSLVVSFINDAIAQINTATDAGFPMLDASDANSEPHFPEEWQRTLLIPYGVGRVKQRDSSQFEYSDAYAQFMQSLEEFKTNYTIPARHKRIKPGAIVVFPNGSEHIAEWGDTIFKLALEHGLDWRDLQELNDNIQFDSVKFAESDIYTQPTLPWFSW